MDRKDELLLAALLQNSRTPMKQLAKHASVSREVADYRIKNLTKQGIIKQFITEIDEATLGCKRYSCTVQLQGISATEEQTIIDAVAKNKHTTYLGPIIGKWNFAFDLIIKEDEDIEAIITTLFSDWRKHIKHYLINSLPIESEFYPAKTFGGTYQEPRTTKNNTPLTTTDRAILKALSTNSRIEYTQLAKHIKLSANAIKHRIKNLETTGIIRNYTVALDYNTIGYSFYNLQLKHLGTTFTKLRAFLRHDKQVKYFYRHLGNLNWDVDIGLLVKNPGELRKFLTKLREQFGKETEIHDLFVIPEATKENILPEIAFT